MTPPSLFSSFAVLFSISAMPLKRGSATSHENAGRKPDFKVGNKLLDDDFPGDEAFNEDIGGSQILGCDIFLDERLVS
jgi:hypothetical protein